MVSMSATVRHLKAVFLETTLGDDIDFTISCYAFSDPLKETYFLRLVSASRGGQESVSFRGDIGEISTVYNRMMGGAVEDKPSRNVHNEQSRVVAETFSSPSGSCVQLRA